MSGKIHRIKSTDNFVVLQKTVLQDGNLSWKAKGLHCYLMQLPADWQINVADLSNRSKDGRDATASALSELQKAGYVKRTKISDEGGKFAGYDYEVHEVKISTTNGKTVNGFSVNGLSVNGKSVTTKNYLNKELSNTDIVVVGEKKSIETELEMALKTEKENLKGGAPAAGAWAEFDAVIEKLKDDDLLKDAFGMNAKCPIDKYGAYLLEFQVKTKGENGNDGYPEKTRLERAMRTHFINWSRRKREEEERTKSKQSQNTGRQYANNRATVNNFGADEEAYKKPQIF